MATHLFLRASEHIKEVLLQQMSRTDPTGLGPGLFPDAEFDCLSFQGANDLWYIFGACLLMISKQQPASLAMVRWSSWESRESLENVVAALRVREISGQHVLVFGIPVGPGPSEIHGACMQGRRIQVDSFCSWEPSGRCTTTTQCIGWMAARSVTQGLVRQQVGGNSDSRHR